MQNEARARTGWASEEKDILWEEVRRATDEGGTLRQAFDSISQKTGRKPNSIRNFYYQSLREMDAPEGVASLRTRSFVPFAEEEVDSLLRTILSQRAKGVSVRACVQEMAGGDRSLALRYQNKYRSILKNHPDRIEQALDRLRAQGVDCPSPYDTMRARRRERPQPLPPSAGRDDPEALLEALRSLIGSGGRSAEIRHREEIDRMTVRMDLLRLELARREEMMLEGRRAGQALRTEALALAEACRELLSAQDIERAKAEIERRAEALLAGAARGQE